MLHYLNRASRRRPWRSASASSSQNVSRRAFLKGTAWGSAWCSPRRSCRSRRRRRSSRIRTGGLDMPNGIITNPHVFVSIDPDGTVTIVAHRSEMGTGARTSLPMVIADEMEADWARVKIVQAPGDEPKYGNQDTDGSRSMRHHIQPMRRSVPRCARCWSRRRPSSGASIASFAGQRTTRSSCSRRWAKHGRGDQRLGS